METSAEVKQMGACEDEMAGAVAPCRVGVVLDRNLTYKEYLFQVLPQVSVAAGTSTKACLNDDSGWKQANPYRLGRDAHRRTAGLGGRNGCSSFVQSRKLERRFTGRPAFRAATVAPRGLACSNVRLRLRGFPTCRAASRRTILSNGIASPMFVASSSGAHG